MGAISNTNERRNENGDPNHKHAINHRAAAAQMLLQLGQWVLHFAG